MCRATLSGPAREFRAGPTAFLAGCSAVWASKATAPGRPPGVLFYISENNLRLQTKNVLAFNLYLSSDFQLPLQIRKKSWLFMTGF
jgi:hypothetical protein